MREITHFFMQITLSPTGSEATGQTSAQVIGALVREKVAAIAAGA